MASADSPETPAQPPGFFARWAAALVVTAIAGAIVAIVVVAPPFDPHEVIRSDGCGYHIWTYAILKGDTSFQWFQGDAESQALHRPDPNEPRYTCKYPPGVALVRLPAMVWVVDASRDGPPYSVAENRMCQALGALALVGVVVLGLLTCRERGLSPWWSQFAVLVLTFGTGLFHYGTFDAGFSHVYSALGVAWLVWQDAKSRRVNGRLSVAGKFGVVIVSALLILIRSTNVFLVAFWAAGTGWRAWSRGHRLTAGWAALLGMLIGFGIILGLNAYMFGRFTLNSYPGEEFLWNRPMMLSVLVSENQGLVPYYPVMAVVVLVGLVARPSRPAAVGLLLLILAFATLYGYWWSWTLGQGFGHRGFVDLVPFAVPVLATALTHLAGRWPQVTRAVALVCLGLTGLTVGLMADYWYWNMPS